MIQQTALQETPNSTKPQPSYRVLTHPAQPMPTTILPRPTCLIPGCDHRPGYGKHLIYCWGHSLKDRVWDGINWEPYYSARNSTECRIGKEGGMNDCNLNHVPEDMRRRYAVQITAIQQTEPPLPGP